MELNQYKEEVKRTCPQLKSNFADQLHMVIGMTTECGELLDAYKKTFAYNKELDIVNLGEEIGDVMWYLVNLCNMLDLDLETLLQVNIDKLKARYPEKWTQDKALNRDLKTERSILESITK